MQETKAMIPYAFELSEKTQQMVIIRLTTRVCHGRGNVVLGELPDKPHPMEQVGAWDRLTCVNYLHEPMLKKWMLFEKFSKPVLIITMKDRNRLRN